MHLEIFFLYREYLKSIFALYDTNLYCSLFDSDDNHKLLKPTSPVANLKTFNQLSDQNKEYQSYDHNTLFQNEYKPG